MVKSLPASAEGKRDTTQIQFLGWEDPPEEGEATHYSVLAWKISWTEEPCRLLSIGLQRAKHDGGSNLAGMQDMEAIEMLLQMNG